MKVNTDGVLLGAAATLPPGCRSVLDAGTGTGTIALILAQRLADAPDAGILGIDIDLASAEEAAQNFGRSPWAGRLEARHLSLSALDNESRQYDLIVSNPPYFDASLPNPEERKKTSRHTSEDGEELSYRTLIRFAAGHLFPEGRLSMILPSSVETALLRYAAGFGLYPGRLLRIRTVERKMPLRLIAEFTKERTPLQEETLVLRNENGYTQEYTTLTGPFYISLK